MRIKVVRITSDHTHLQSWQTYYFQIDGKTPSILVEKSDGVFKFWSKHCKTLAEAKKHIESCVLAKEQI